MVDSLLGYGAIAQSVLTDNIATSDDLGEGWSAVDLPEYGSRPMW